MELSPHSYPQILSEPEVDGMVVCKNDLTLLISCVAVACRRDASL